MTIMNDRNEKDSTCLKSSYWSGKEQGKNGYPTKSYNGGYLIQGGTKTAFRAKQIEIFGAEILLKRI